MGGYIIRQMQLDVHGFDGILLFCEGKPDCTDSAHGFCSQLAHFMAFVKNLSSFASKGTMTELFAKEGEYSGHDWPLFPDFASIASFLRSMVLMIACQRNKFEHWKAVVRKIQRDINLTTWQLEFFLELTAFELFFFILLIAERLFPCFTTWYPRNPTLLDKSACFSAANGNQSCELYLALLDILQFWNLRNQNCTELFRKCVLAYGSALANLNNEKRFAYYFDDKTAQGPVFKSIISNHITDYLNNNPDQYVLDMCQQNQDIKKLLHQVKTRCDSLGNFARQHLYIDSPRRIDSLVRPTRQQNLSVVLRTIPALSGWRKGQGE
jgi:hypothetical protein